MRQPCIGVGLGAEDGRRRPERVVQRSQALRRLAARGKLMKIARGGYALPISSRFGTRPPAPQVVIAQLNREGAQQLVSSGAAAANALGLTTQMPVQQTFLARTRSQKRYVFGKQQVTIRPAAAWNFLLPDRPGRVPWSGGLAVG